MGHPSHGLKWHLGWMYPLNGNNLLYLRHRWYHLHLPDRWDRRYGGYHGWSVSMFRQNLQGATWLHHCGGYRFLQWLYHPSQKCFESFRFGFVWYFPIHFRHESFPEYLLQIHLHPQRRLKSELVAQECEWWDGFPDRFLIRKPPIYGCEPSVWVIVW